MFDYPNTWPEVSFVCRQNCVPAQHNQQIDSKLAAFEVLPFCESNITGVFFSKSSLYGVMIFKIIILYGNSFFLCCVVNVYLTKI